MVNFSRFPTDLDSFLSPFWYVQSSWGGMSDRSEVLRRRYVRWGRGLRLGDDGGKWIGGRSNPRRKRLKCWIRSRQMGSFKISSAILSQLRHITVHILNIQERKRQPFIHSYCSYKYKHLFSDNYSWTVSILKKVWLLAEQSHQQYLMICI